MQVFILVVVTFALLLCNAAGTTKNEIIKDLTMRGYNVTEETLEYFLSPATIKAGTSSDEHQWANKIDNEKNGGIDPAEIWQIGKEVWELVKENKPSSNVSTDWTGAVPKGIDDWTTMENWKDRQSEEYYIEFKNGLGMRLTEFRWVFSFKSDGMFQGKGGYITEAGVAIKKVYAYLSEHIEVSAHAFHPINYGTAENPVAGIDLQINLKSWGMFETTTVGCHVIMRGDGTQQLVTCDNGTHKTR